MHVQCTTVTTVIWFSEGNLSKFAPQIDFLTLVVQNFCYIRICTVLTTQM